MHAQLLDATAHDELALVGSAALRREQNGADEHHGHGGHGALLAANYIADEAHGAHA
jgi:hypothetical protein